MDTKANESSFSTSLHLHRTDVPLQVQEQEHLSGDIEAPNPLDQPAVICQVARTLAQTFEMREAKIREIQEAVKSGTYHVPADQIADKMLQDTLREQLP